MKPSAARISGGEEEEEAIIPESQLYLKRRKITRQLFGSDSEDEFLAPQRVPRKRCRIISPKRGKILVHKVEIVRPPRVEVVHPEVEAVLISDDDDATQMDIPERAITPDIIITEAKREPGVTTEAEQAPAEQAQSEMHWGSDISDIRTPDRAITPDIAVSESEWEPEAQPIVEPEELELMGEIGVFTEFAGFEVMCGSAKVVENYKLPQQFTGCDKKTRMLRPSYVPIDRLGRKFISVGLNPHTGFIPSVCLSFDTTVYILQDFAGLVQHLRLLQTKLSKTHIPTDRVVRECTDFRSTLMRGRRVRLAVHKTIWKRKLEMKEYITLSESEMGSIIACEEYIEKKVKFLKDLSIGVERKYLQLIQRAAIRAVINSTDDEDLLRGFLRSEMLSEEDNLLNDLWWEVYVYHREKIMNHLKNVLGFILTNDMFVVTPR